MLMKEPFEMHCGYSVAAFFGSWTNSREVLLSSAAVGVYSTLKRAAFSESTSFLAGSRADYV